MTQHQPTWTEQYRLGSQVNQQMEHFCTLQELADELGITKQNAHTEAVMALGILAWRLRERLGLPQTGPRS